ncbi:MAG: LPS export ABC transporter periplasmic protein LptC [Chitinispirillaceae bacterium]|nr:LPS export ABC transporter periplasmic protein LptC [Chitinispirillaceae bacterium]
MKHRRVPLVPIALLLLASSLLCTRKKEELPLAAGEIQLPLQKFAGTTLLFFNKGYTQWKLDADSMCKPVGDTGTISVFPVRLTLFDSTGNVRSTVLADSGKIGSNMQNYYVWGNVFIRTRDSMLVRTESLRWFKERRRVESDTFVQIETKKGDILRGKGLDAKEDFSRFSFKSDVKGAFPDFQKRVESNDTAMF